MKQLKNQRGIVGLIELLLVAVVISAFTLVIYRAVNTKPIPTGDSAQDTPVEQAKEVAEQVEQTEPHAVVSEKPTSPDGKYTVTQKTSPGVQVYVLKSNGVLIADNIPTASHGEQMGLGTKIQGQYGIHFKGWMDSDTFVWRINNGAGEEFEYLVDASTGEPDISSYRKTK